MDKNRLRDDSSNEVLFKLTLLFSIYQFILHAYYTLLSNDQRMLIPNVIAYIHDIAILLVTSLLCLIVIYFSNERYKRLQDRIFGVIIFIEGIILSAYPKVLREYLAFPINIFDADTNSASTFILDYLGLSALAPSLVAFILGIVVVITKYEIHLSFRKTVWIATVFLIIFIFTLTNPSPQPIIYSIQTEIGSIFSNQQREVQSLIKPFSENKHPFSDTLCYSQNEVTNYKHILLIVFEGVTARDFEKEFIQIPNGFYKQNRNKVTYYDNYYSTNLDSYTSLISMLTAIQVPYRAYSDESLYNDVNKAPSLTKDFHKRGFSTLFVSTYEYQPFVPTKTYWSKILERNNLPNSSKYFSLGSNRMESASEDKAAIPTIIDFVKQNTKTFILHELVYGHSPEWRAKTGKTQLQYYNEYLLQLSDELSKNGLLDSSLFVIVSDHGNRAKSSDFENYRVPLLIRGNNTSFEINNNFLSHIDIPGIIYYYTAKEKHPTSQPEIFFVGSSEKWVYGKANRNKDYIFINDASGTILSKRGGINPIKLRNEFQEYLNLFDSIFHKED
ncbi:MAG: sulfatase-like hydrolase/transferase [Ignavibacteriaceae bacterium]